MKGKAFNMIISLLLYGFISVALAGRCDREWLPYLYTSKSGYGRSQPKIVDLLTLAKTTDRKGVQDMIQSRLAASSSPTLRSLQIQEANVQVQGTFAGVAISVRLDKTCDFLLQDQTGWHGKISTSKSRRNKPGAKLPNDTKASDGIRNHLFATATSGFDLVALNIQ